MSGATRAQLAYWRKHIEPFGALLVPEGKRGRALLYSIADVLALRSIVYLREEKSLPKIRRAVAFLRAIEQEDWTHLADYTLVRVPETIYLLREDGEIVDLEAAPGNEVIPLGDEPDRRDVRMQLVLSAFQSSTGREVPDFRVPRPGIRIERSVLGGYPVVEGTRVPYDAIATLAVDGADYEVVRSLYPSVPESVLGSARELSELVARAA
jgi:uncharacterized protein (DUF433 family)